MSLFGAMTTAISGLNGQSAAFSNISDNVANDQTVGFKRVDTSFADYLTDSTATENDPGSVVTKPDYVNNVQGSITQSDDPTAMAISGSGFFSVSQATGTTSTGQTIFSPQAYYTRAGDFQLNQSGYLVNSAGYYLNAWPVSATTGLPNTNALGPVQVNQTTYSPIPTTSVTLSANLPATPATTGAIPTQIEVYDALGTAHAVTLNWTQTGTNTWTVAVSSPDDTAAADRGTADVTFGGTLSDGTTASAGTPSSVTANAGDPGTIAGSTNTPNAAATFSFTTNFGSGNQTVTINLGEYGTSTGTTQFAGTTYTLNGLTQNGVPPGNFSGITTQTNGNIVANYSNGQTRVVAQVPLTVFNNPDGLQSQNGQAFTATEQSGTPLTNAVGTNGAGAIVTGSVEGSNVDIANELSQLIVAQEAYTANAKVVTTADQLLQVTVNMKT